MRGYPERTFPGTVALVYPHLNPATRTVRVRIELANPHLLLKPDMYAEAEIDTSGGNAVLAVPDSAVIDSGERQIVLVDKGEGRFEPRAVQLGRRGAGYVEIREGLEGERKRRHLGKFPDRCGEQSQIGAQVLTAPEQAP